ncbi:MAG: DNA repair protein RadC [Patescibacteria group bacterium]|nr:DNA repair protein RadC [Patescibacteria group bacterium]
MSSFSSFPKNEKPRERMINYGVEFLSLTELFALIFSRGIKNFSVIDISQRLISHFGSLDKIKEASIEDLKKIKGIGLTKACQIKACFEIGRRLYQEEKTKQKKSSFSNKKFITPKDIFLQIKKRLVNYYKEHLFVVCLTNYNDIICVEEVSRGTLNQNLVHPREVFETAIKNHSAQIILAHNHPSEVLEPSKEDILITKKLLEAGKIMGIEIIDHLIIGKNDYFSMAEKKILI